MKLLCIVFFSFLLAGCAGSRMAAPLSPKQATALAVRLANDKAFTEYQCRPFRDMQSAHFVTDHWMWTDRAGYGQGDMEAEVELAADGSPRSVKIRLLDSRAILSKEF